MDQPFKRVLVIRPVAKKAAFLCHVRLELRQRSESKGFADVPRCLFLYDSFCHRMLIQVSHPTCTSAVRNGKSVRLGHGRRGGG